MRLVLYLDVDAYYVSCELRDRPELRGLPVIVGPPPSEGPSRGVVLSASYEARRSGVRSALPVREAKRLCPEAKWIPPDFEKYARLSRELRAYLRSRFSPVSLESIDEAAIPLDVETPNAASRIAADVQLGIRELLQLPVSIGIGPSRSIAKIASETAKPAGIVVVPPDKVREFLEPLNVRAIPGVGPKTAEHLRSVGIDTIGQLARASMKTLSPVLGSWSRGLLNLARGVVGGEDEFVTRQEPRSHSSDLTFDVDVSELEPLLSSVANLSTSLGSSLEEERLRYQTVSVAVRWSDFDRTQRGRTLATSQDGSTPLIREAVRLARELWSDEQQGRRRSARTVSVRVERLTVRRQRQARLDSYSAMSSPQPS